MIGVLEDFEEVKEIKTKYGYRNIVKFRITDGRNSSKVTVWGDLAVSTNEKFNQVEEKPIIVIVTSTKLKIYKNSTQASTMSSSKVYLNLDFDTVIEMRQRLAEEGYTPGEIKPPTPIIQDETTFIENKTLKDLSEITDNEYIKKFVFCEIKVISVEEKISWWHNSCVTCETEINMKQASLFCTTCNVPISVAEKRYRIVILGEDSTEAYNFILMDRAAKRLLGTSTTKMQTNIIKSKTTGFPSQITALAGKDLKLKILISKDNIVANSRLYYAFDVANNNASSSPMTGTTTSSYSSSTFSDVSLH
ncbi:uncharacterized protein LOC141716794 isoform X2 [Apium graveolens]|uniref:uncharacterized protein LOC141716794 isoform X2 n=1 Tax=Apium graveolens TaxID=4045 RepID=UPI003D7A06CD